MDLFNADQFEFASSERFAIGKVLFGRSPFSDV